MFGAGLGSRIDTQKQGTALVFCGLLVACLGRGFGLLVRGFEHGLMGIGLGGLMYSRFVPIRKGNGLKNRAKIELKTHG